MTHKVFVNRTLNMKQIKFIGLDMDHTLIRYQTKQFEALVYKMVLDYLVTEKGYPDAIYKFKFDFDAAIRGLVVDAKNGNVLKLSRYGAIKQSYHGTKLIAYSEQKAIYSSTYVDLKDPNYAAIDTSFSIAFCVLFSQLIDYKDKKSGLLPDYAEITSDVLHAVDEVHARGELKAIIRQDLERYVIKDEALVQGLQRYIRHGKKFFILTNSDFAYTNTLLTYAITPFLEKGQHWSSLFEYVITLATKPRFFYDNARFLSIDPLTGLMKNTQGSITPGVYQGGSAHQFTRDLKLEGSHILYIGDHIYGDILRLKKACNWRTALVVEELSHEIEQQQKAAPIEDQVAQATLLKADLEQAYFELLMLQEENFSEENQTNIDKLQHQIAQIDRMIVHLLEQLKVFYNHRWGRVFRAGSEESYFAHQVDRFACIYMEKLSDLLHYSPRTYFRAHIRSLAHDVNSIT